MSCSTDFANRCLYRWNMSHRLPASAHEKPSKLPGRIPHLEHRASYTGARRTSHTSCATDLELFEMPAFISGSALRSTRVPETEYRWAIRKFHLPVPTCPPQSGNSSHTNPAPPQTAHQPTKNFHSSPKSPDVEIKGHENPTARN